MGVHCWVAGGAAGGVAGGVAGGAAGGVAGGVAGEPTGGAAGDGEAREGGGGSKLQVGSLVGLGPWLQAGSTGWRFGAPHVSPHGIRRCY